MERLHYIEDTDQLVTETIYDPTDVIEQNAAERAEHMVRSYSSVPKMAGLTKVASIHVDHITALKNMGYNLLSPDPAEARRALCYIQENEPVWMTVNGKPFAKFRPKWR